MFKTLNGIEINYVLEGEGDLVVLLHGWGSNITLFNNMIALLSSKYRVLALDMPGFGQSDEPEDVWDVDKYTDFVIDFVKDFAEENERVVFLGHSFGGRVIIKMNARENLPYEISKIILVDSAGVRPRVSTSQKIKQGIFGKTKKILTSDAVTKAFPNLMDNLRNMNGSADYLAASPLMRQVLVKVVNEDLTELFPLVTVPTLLIWGELDTATPVSDAKIMEEKMKDAGLVVIPGCGHYSFLEGQVMFNRVLASFMNL